MPDRESFIAAIAAAPADDLPRLVFADWLDENGDPDRARFIRDQIALTKLRPGTDEYKATFRRTADTLRANLPGWIQSACDTFGQPTEWSPGKARGPGLPIRFKAAEAGHPLQHVEFARGFIDQATLRLPNVKRANAVDALFQLHPISRLNASFFMPGEQWQALDTARFRGVRRLAINGAFPDTATAVFASPHFENVYTLAINSGTLADTLVRSPMARRLTSLTVDPETVQVGSLVDYPLDDKLREFALRAAGPDPSEVRLWPLLSRVAFRPTLKRLDLTRCGMTDDGLAAFARGETWLRLQGLKLGGNLFGDSGWADFARGWRTPELTYLDVSRNRLTDRSAEALARSGMVQTLRTIDLRGCRIGGRGALALANAARSGPLRSLLLAGNLLKPKDVAAVRKVLGERVDVGGIG